MPSAFEHLVVDRVDQIAQNIERSLPDFAGTCSYAAAWQIAGLVHTGLLAFLFAAW